MKILKYFIVFIFMFLGLKASASEYPSEYALYTAFCPAEPYEIANPVTRGVQSATGLNLIASKVAAKEIKKNLEKIAQGDIKVKVHSFSATDAKQGKFKHFEVKGKGICLYSIFISEIIAKTRCNFIHLNMETNPIELKEPMVIDFTAHFTEEDLNNILKTTVYKKYFLSLKFNSKKLNLIEISQPRVSLKNDKFHFAANVKMPFVKMFIFNIISDLKIVDNKIKITNMVIGTNSKKIDVSTAKYFAGLFNPLWFAQVVLEEHDCKTLLKNVKIRNEQVIVDGSVFLRKS